MVFFVKFFQKVPQTLSILNNSILFNYCIKNLLLSLMNIFKILKSVLCDRSKCFYLCLFIMIELRHMTENI